MKAAQLQAFGKPETVVAYADVPDPPAPGANEISADIDAFPINPADLHQCEGTYAVRPDLPALIGAESVGTVTVVGTDVRHLKPGDRIIFRDRGNWVQKKTVPASEVIRLPDAFQGDISDQHLHEAAMLKVNPATALMILRDFVTPEPGDWLIHNAANSGVGTHVVNLAAIEGWRAINVVRSEQAADAVRAAGGDIVLMDTDDLPDRVADLRGDASVRLAIDSVGGTSARRLANAVSENATMVTFGRISGKAMQIDSRNLIFRGLTIKGFWLAEGLSRRTPAAVDQLYADLASAVLKGTLKTRVEATYPLSQIKQALAHAGRGGRTGKILVRPQQEA